MISTILEKLLDALYMFWQALDFGERRIVTFVAVYFAVALAAVVYRAFTRTIAEDAARIIVGDPEPAVGDKTV
jgi:ABC-type tungstate transport system substrate-binding protein